MDQWISLAASLSFTEASAEMLAARLSRSPASCRHLVDTTLTLADILVFAAAHELAANAHAPVAASIGKWIDALKQLPFFAAGLRMYQQACGRAAADTESAGSAAAAQFVDLPGAEMGKVVTRFPPEASGYLHIGHVKAAMLNDYYARMFRGKLIMRFDDTNPAKEKEDYETAILEDLKRLDIHADVMTCTSDHFDFILTCADRLIREGQAYVDDTPMETMRTEREAMVESGRRAMPLVWHLEMWDEMKRGTERGQACCLRAKIDMKSSNGCLRDPVLFRCKLEPHVRTGTTYKVYPTYDFACPIVDSIEGVTHALRTTEYHDRNEQYAWVISVLHLRPVTIYDYSRLALVHTVLSKRKLQWFVDKGIVSGWADPRFPTVRGILRRGMTVEALREFITAQGSSRSVVLMEWDKIWAINKKHIDPVAPRVTALSHDTVALHLLNGPKEPIQSAIACHPKNDAIGSKQIWQTNELLIEREDAETVAENETITLINWGNAVVRRIRRGAQGAVTDLDVELNLSDTDYKKTKKFTWLPLHAPAALVPVNMVEFDYLITKAKITDEDDFEQFVNPQSRFDTPMYGEQHMAQLKNGDRIQLLRRGYFICDRPYDPTTQTPCELFNIPDGHHKSVASLSSKGSCSSVSVNSGGGGEAARAKQAAKQPATALPAPSEPVDALVARIVAQGDKVRTMKAAKADKAAVQAEVDALLKLKADYRSLTGKEYRPAVSGDDAAPTTQTRAKPRAGGAEAAPAEAMPERATGPTVPAAPAAGVTRLGLEAKKLENFAEWYSQTITKAEMIEYYDVSGCYILRPWAYAIWDAIREFFDREIKALGVENCYFPMFVTAQALSREKEHVADFAPEVAWVTRSGDSNLAEPIALRPTSETVMYPAFAKWIKSHRDLPLKLNQWANVVRWEFKHPTPFLRTREFLWQEGHTVFATKAESDTEVLQILGLYQRVYEELLAVPVIPGTKTEKEKFAGGLYTTTVECYIGATGRGIQGATSHSLGQNFSRMFDIRIDSPGGGEEKAYVWQNSWGITTRTIGVTVMVHGDDKGLVLPPRVAAIQAIIVPCGVTAATTPEERSRLYGYCDEVVRTLRDAGVRARSDLRDNYTPGWKFNHWELKGVPLRMEVGPRDMAADQVLCVRRDNGVRVSVKRAALVADVQQQLQTIQADMLHRATVERDANVALVETWADFVGALDNKKLVLAPWCSRKECEEDIKKNSAKMDEMTGSAMGAKSLCIPFKQPKPIGAGTMCARCGQPATVYCLFGRSY